MEKTIQKALMLYQLWQNSFMHWDVGLLNGELFLKFKKDVLLSKLFMKMLGDWLDMLLFANKMVLFLLLNQKYFLMAITLLNIARESLKEF